MKNNDIDWLPFDQAAKRYGYKNVESFRQRIRQLRNRGQVRDFGKPPKIYKVNENKESGEIEIFWPSSKVALIRSDASKELLNPKMGKRKI